MLSTSEAHQQLLQQAASSSSSLSSSTPAGKNAAAVSKQHFVVGGKMPNLTGCVVLKLWLSERYLNDACLPLQFQPLLEIGTLDGGILVMTPVTEKLYKRLYALYSRMVNNLQHAAGLNPRGFR
ncbi:hypothetical protein HK102_011465 [Quaeritorhiza haematococci]|nr:hypothetical protein HK102_011465 [Quaeritorhiza haematococci]